MKEVWQSIKQLIYPRKCSICRRLLETSSQEDLCTHCHKGVLRESICQRCGRPYLGDESGCLHCQAIDLGQLRRVIGLFTYTEGYRKAILRWKYKGIRKYARSFADLFVNDLCILELLKIEGLVPVPLAPIRQKDRGFNQALDLAREISKQTKIDTYDCLERIRNTKPQAQCKGKERIENIKGSIAVKKDTHLPQLKRIAIVDDIYTTGSTAKECAQVLKQEYSLRDCEVYLLVVGIGV